jgi:DNA-damage-inducible protein D
MLLKKEGGQSIFESIKRTNANGEDFWSARDLSKVLDYAEYRNFQPVLAKAVEACESSENNPDDHFVHLHDMIEVGKGAKRSVKDMRLSRYACYLVIQNADPAKEIELKLKRNTIHAT